MSDPLAHSPPAAVAIASQPSPTSLRLRFFLIVVLVGIGCTLAYVFFKTPVGGKLRSRAFVHAWVAHHRLVAPLVVLAVYVLFGTLMLPVWWLQMAAGYCFGFWRALLWCELGAILTAMVSLNLSRWLLGEWLHARYESRMEKLRRFDVILGHNGLLVVMAVRLTHLIPFGISNYLFGLTRITTLDVALGTFLGGMVALAFYIACGVGGLVSTWRFWVALILVNLLLLVPLFLRYRFPKWYHKAEMK